jgi:dinuclear metal center YbgI/SA1388 family protein
MPTVREIYNLLDKIAPVSLQMDFDNAGFLVGEGERKVSRVLVSLDITEAVVEEALQKGAQLIVSHHPVIFQPVKRITDEDKAGRTLLALIRGGISAICMHTNLDAVQGGVNDKLAEAAGLEITGLLEQDGTDGNGAPYGIGRTGNLKAGPTPLPAYAEQLKHNLGCNGLRFYDAGRPVHSVAVGGGACGDMLADAMACGCDTFVTSDVKYDVFLEAQSMGMNLIDAGHYPTEDVITAPLVQWLREGFPGLQVERTAVHREVIQFM